MDLIGSSCRLQPTTADDRDALLAIRSAPEVGLAVDGARSIRLLGRPTSG